MSPRHEATVAVSVLVITYNHARVVRQALDGALAQRLPPASFEILSSEDCSTDGTREIVEEHAPGHPNHIRLLPSERNLHKIDAACRMTVQCIGFAGYPIATAARKAA